MRYLTLLVLFTASAIGAESFDSLMTQGREAATKHPKEAIQFYEKIYQQKSYTPDQQCAALLQAARCAIRANNTDQAMELMKRFLTDFPNKSEALLKAVDDIREARTLLNVRKEGKRSSGDQHNTFSGPDLYMKLETIVLPSISFEETPIREVFKELRKKSVALDAEGKGIHFFLYLSSPHTGKAPKVEAEDTFDNDDVTEDIDAERLVTISMDFDSIPLAEAIRYICEQAGLRYAIKPYGVEILGPDVERGNLKVAFKRIDLEKHLDSETIPSTELIKQWFKDKGVSFPTLTNGKKASLSYHHQSKTLITVNTPENLRRIERIFGYICGGWPNQMQVSVRLFEINLPSDTLSPPIFTPSLVKAIPNTHKRCIAEATLCAEFSTKASTTVESTTNGSRSAIWLETTPKMLEDWATIRLPFSITFKQWVKGGSEPTVQLTCKTSVTVWDNEPMVFNLTSNAADKLQRVMVVTARSIDSTGHVRRDSDGNAGRLDEALKILLGSDYEKRTMWMEMEQ